ncbi:Methyltransferase-like protein 6 [Gracilariopsis chorda]|uniref:tRNA N(3)-methylcytidine methyltransferase n=1 Tax=Gracilariopsis chorda TaxID=448386 RepID=A0A2V3IIQ8_9FLOR|nr:Methyltransferase-like protein 6 [Gracilariopsis chorda]|eukprot:PXF41976.1 Methyltransferase-like protein 6 [Gracilariopsis chorda]
MDPDLYRSAQTQSGVSPFWAQKYSNDASKNWEKFYKRNSTNFFKDRHWTSTESTDGFPCLAEHKDDRTVVVEAGCGVANCAFPLLDTNPNIFVHAFDFAPTAIELIKSNGRYDEDRMNAFVWDFCTQPLSEVDRETRGSLESGEVDFCLLVFVLSAVPPAKHASGLRNLYNLLKPGGKVLFRDYATGDLAQNRFSCKNRIDENYYVRQDRTLSFFFSEEELRSCMAEIGFEEIYVRRVQRIIENRKEKLKMNRVFLQAEFGKPRTDQ